MCEHWLIWYFCLVRDGAVLLNFYYICQLLYIILLNQTHYIVKCKNLIYWRKLSTLFYLSSVILWTSVMNFFCVVLSALSFETQRVGCVAFFHAKKCWNSSDVQFVLSFIYTCHRYYCIPVACCGLNFKTCIIAHFVVSLAKTWKAKHALKLLIEMLLEPVFYADYIMINADAMFIFKKDMDRSN